MPTYKVTDPTTQKAITIKGNRQPTDQEIGNIFNHINSKQAAPKPTMPQPTMPSSPEAASVSGFGKNLLSSGYNTAAGLIQPILHPINTATNLAKTAVGTVQLGLDKAGIIEPQEWEAYPKAIGQHYKDKYGGIQNIKNTLYNDPVGTALDAATVLSAGAGVVGKVGKVAEIADSAKLANTLGTVSNGLTKASNLVDPLNYAGKAVSLATKPVRNVFTKARDYADNTLPLAGLGNPQPLGKAIKQSGMNAREFFNENNLWDKTPESAQAAIKKIDDAYTTAVQTGDKVTVKAVVQSFKDSIAKAKENGLLSDSEAAKAEILSDRLERFKGVVGKKRKLSPEDVLDFKRKTSKDLSQSDFANGADNKLMGNKAGVDETFDIFRKTLNEQSPATKTLGNKEAAAIKIKDIFTKAENRANARQSINFTKLGGAGIGAAVGGLPAAVIGYFLEDFARNPQTAKYVSNFIGKAKLPAIPSFAKTAGKQVFNKRNARIANVLNNR